MEKQNVVYAYNRKYSASRRKEILTCAIKWRNLEETILSEISQSQKDKDCYDSTYEEVSRIGTFVDTESRTVVFQG